MPLRTIDDRNLRWLGRTLFWTASSCDRPSAFMPLLITCIWLFSGRFVVLNSVKSFVQSMLFWDTRETHAPHGTICFGDRFQGRLPRPPTIHPSSGSHIDSPQPKLWADIKWRRGWWFLTEDGDDVDDNKPWCIIIKHPSSCLVFFIFILTIDPITCCSYSQYCSIYETIKRSLHSVAGEEDLKVILNGIRKSWNVLCLWSRIKEMKPFNIIIHRTSLFHLFHSSEGSTHHCPCHQRNTNTFPPNPIDLMWFIN